MEDLHTDLIAKMQINQQDNPTCTIAPNFILVKIVRCCTPRSFVV